MDKQTAVRIIRDTFESPFDKARFVDFIKNLLNKIDENKAFPIIHGHYIPESFRGYVKAYERIGTYTDPADINSKVDILIVHLQREKSLERARTAQRNFVARYLKERDEKEAGLVAFVSPDEVDWRFSLVKMDYLLEDSPSGKTKVRTELTPARRFSFIVGENESSHTAQSQLVPILQDDAHDPTLKQLEAAFNIEKVTKEFFEKYRELFHNVQEALEDIVSKDKKVRDDFTAKAMSPVDFAKKLLGQIVFLYFLQKKGWFGVGRDKDWGTGPKNFLRLLFNKKNVSYHNFFNDVLEPLFYEALATERTDYFYSRFNCKIPFLNGGLFDPINNYDWVHADILLPNELFSNSQKTKEGDVGTGLLDVFDRYNFTVKEDEPLEREVAIDPEMLGKVFENLLEVKDRKSKGTYYTPREIVHYMCQESLINYLDTTINTGDVSLVPTRPPQGKLFGQPDPEQTTLKATGYRVLIPREDIEAFVHRGEFAVEHDSRVEAHGKETQHYSYKLPENIRQNASLIDENLATIRICDPAVGSGAFLVGMMTEIVRTRNVLTTYLPDEKVRSNYIFKRHAIQNCLYGVDIDPGAVEIAKLRLWLSLVVDEEDIKQIQPLPNLDYKIVCGNSLLGVEKNLFNVELFNDLEKLKPLYFNETNAKKKQELRKQIDQLIKSLTNDNETFDFEVYFSEVFHEKGGFDVVIANPPYGLINKRQNKGKAILVRQEDLKYYKSHAEYAPAMSGMINIYRLFILKSISVLGQGGVFVEIFPLSFIADVSASSLRNHILKNNTLDFIEAFPERDDEKRRVFEHAKMSVCIVQLQKDKKQNTRFFVRIHHDKCIDFKNEKAYFDLDTLSLFNKENLIIPLMSQKEVDVVAKVYEQSIRLREIGHCYTGELDLTLGKKYLTNDSRNAVLIKGAIIDKYLIRKEMSQGEIMFLDSKRYLSENKGHKSSHHKIARIVMQGITGINEITRLKMTIAKPNVYCGNSVNYIIFNEPKEDLNYYLAILNTKLLDFIFHKFSTNSNVNGYEVDNLPSPRNIDERAKERIADLAQNILSAKNTNPQADTTAFERQIDQLVYQLYALTPEEIAVVEDSYNK